MRRASNGNLVVTDVNPDDDEHASAEASEFGIFPVEFNVLRDDQFEIRRGYYGLAIVYADWFHALPADWIELATMRLGNKLISAGHDEVTFFALDEGTRVRTAEILETFRGTLPRGVDFEFAAGKGAP